MTGPAKLAFGDVLVRLDPPVAAGDDVLPIEWGQEHIYGQPLWGRTLLDATSRVSVWTQRAGLMLVDRWAVPQFPHLLRFLGTGDRRDYSVRMAESADPLRDGYFVALAFGEGGDEPQAHGLADVLAAFVAAEAARLDDQGPVNRVEAELARSYRWADPAVLETDPVYRYVDVPGFDSGTMSFGFGVLVDDGEVVRLWSRPIHYHK